MRIGIDRRELKRQAREAMKASKPPFLAVALVYFAMTSLVSMVLQILPFGSDSGMGPGFVGLFVTILYTFYSWIAEFGMDLWSLWTVRRLQPGISALTQGFSVAVPVVTMQMQIIIRVLGWLLMATILTLPLMMTGMGFLLSTAASALVMVITLRYALAPYLLADSPESGAVAAVKRSRDLMQGWTWELLKLELSFFGWMLLSAALTYGVQSFFLMQTGIFAGDMSGLLNTAEGLTRFQEAVNSVTSNPVATVLSTLVTLPVFVWYVPYRSTALAGFYEARLQAQKAALSEFPPL